MFAILSLAEAEAQAMAQWAHGEGLSVDGSVRIELSTEKPKSEIDEIAKATFGSIRLATMLRLIDRQTQPARRPAARTKGR